MKMGNYTREEILQMAEEKTWNLSASVPDMFGTLKNIAITARELPAHWITDVS